MAVINLERMYNETPFEYHKRLVYGKLVDKTLADVDYSELAELTYGQSYSSDVARRMFYGSRKTLELLDTESIKDIDHPDVIEELNAKILELQKERQRFSDQRREFNKLVAQDARLEHLYDVLMDSASCLSDTVGCVFPEVVINRGDSSGNEGVLVFNDWHYGMIASNVFNTYNIDICKSRIHEVVSAAMERLALHGCSKLHIVVLGDLFHGAAHTSARVASEELVCDQMMQVSEVLAQSIIMLSSVVDSVDVYMTYGNHARTVQNKNDSIHRDNMERIIPWWLEQRICADELRTGQELNVRIIPESASEFLLFNVCGHDFCASHGDLDGVKSSPRLLSTLFQKKFNKDIEYVLLADKHHRESFDELGISAMISGSLCGTDDYANDRRLYSTPSQLLLIVNEECGVDAEYRLKCT